MADYLFRGDPNLPEALYQRNWLSFLKALETTTPELIRSLDAACFKAFTILAGEYAKLSPYQFGALTCEWDGRPALTAFPLGDLANLICRPNSEKPSNPWPPSAFYWDSVLRAPLLELREAMREWSQNFMATEGILHSRLVDAGLETMSAWLQEPQLPHVAPWYGIGECIPRQCFNCVQVQSHTELKPDVLRSDLAFELNKIGGIMNTSAKVCLVIGSSGGLAFALCSRNSAKVSFRCTARLMLPAIKTAMSSPIQ